MSLRCPSCNGEIPLSEMVREILKQNRRALYIGRLPDRYKEEFLARASEMFDNDFGMTMMDVMMKANMFEIMTSEKQEEPKEEKVIRTVNGKILENKKVERIEVDINESGSI